MKRTKTRLVSTRATQGRGAEGAKGADAGGLTLADAQRRRSSTRGGARGGCAVLDAAGRGASSPSRDDRERVQDDDAATWTPAGGGASRRASSARSTRQVSPHRSVRIRTPRRAPSHCSHRLVHAGRPGWRRRVVVDDDRSLRRRRPSRGRERGRGVSLVARRAKRNHFRPRDSARAAAMALVGGHLHRSDGGVDQAVGHGRRGPRWTTCGDSGRGRVRGG